MKLKSSIKKNGRLIIISLGTMIAVGTGAFSSTHMGYALKMENQPVIYGRSAEALFGSIEEIQKELNNELGLSNVFIANPYAVEPEMVFNLEDTAPYKIKDQFIKKNLDLEVNGVEVQVNNKTVEYFESELQAQAIVDAAIQKKVASQEGENIKSVDVKSQIVLEKSVFPLTELSTQYAKPSAVKGTVPPENKVPPLIVASVLVEPLPEIGAQGSADCFSNPIVAEIPPAEEVAVPPTQEVPVVSETPPVEEVVVSQEVPVVSEVPPVEEVPETDSKQIASVEEVSLEEAPTISEELPVEETPIPEAASIEEAPMEAAPIEAVPIEERASIKAAPMPEIAPIEESPMVSDVVSKQEVTRKVASVKETSLPEARTPSPKQKGEAQLENTIPEGSKLEEALEVESQKEGIELEPIPYETVVQDNPEIYFDQPAQVLQAGIQGELTRVILYTTKNGETTSQMVSETITTAPIDQILIKGTKRDPIVVAPPQVEVAQPTPISETEQIPVDPLIKEEDAIRLPAAGLITSVDKPGSHEGGKAIDIANDTGTPIRASINGRVTLSEYYGGYGMAVIIENEENGYSVLVGHMSELIVKVGDVVKRGDTVGLMGNTGNSTGPHTHFEIMFKGQKQNVLNYFPLEEGEHVTGNELSLGVTKINKVAPYEKVDNLNLFYRTVAAEAGGESYEGMLAVASCIIRTAETTGKTVSQVILSPGQYSCISDGRVNTAVPSSTVKSASNAAINGARVLDADTQYFYAPGTVASPWHESLTYTGTIGGHRFFKK